MLNSHVNHVISDSNQISDLSSPHLLCLELLLELVYPVRLLPDESRVLPCLGGELLDETASLQGLCLVLH